MHKSKKYLMSAILVVFLLSLGISPLSAQVSEEGGSGLIRVQRALTSGQGQWSFGFFNRYFKQELQGNSDVNIHNFWNNMNATWAVTDELEISGSLPAIGWLQVDNNQTIGSLEDQEFEEFAFGDFSAKMKFSLPVITRRVRLATEGFITFPSGKDDTKKFPSTGYNVRYASPFTSGTYSYGARGLFSISTKDTRFPMLIHLNAGMRFSDDDQKLFYHSYPSPIMEESAMRDGESEFTNELLDVGIGIEFPIFTNFNLFGEFHTEQLIDADDLIKAKENPAYIGGGVKIPFAGKSELTLAGLYRLSEDDDETAFNPEESFSEWQTLIGLSFSVGLYGKGQPRSTPPPSYPIVEAAPVAEPVADEDLFGDVVEEKPIDMPEPVASSPDTIFIRTEVIAELSDETGSDPIEQLSQPTSPPQTINNPMVVINVGQPGGHSSQPMQYVDEEGNIKTLYPKFLEPVYGQQNVMYQGSAVVPPLPAVSGVHGGSQHPAQACIPASSPAPKGSVDPSVAQPTSPQQSAPVATKPAGTPAPAQPQVAIVAGQRADLPDSLRDSDLDGIIDTKDRCSYTPENYNGFQDDDGCPDTPPADFTITNMYQDSDGDGIADYVDKCVNISEDWDGFEDFDGCPELDNDQDGIPDKTDKCPLIPEVYNGIEDMDGCPEEFQEEKSEEEADSPDKVIVNPQAASGTDTDADGIEDLFDHCADRAEDWDGFEDGDGCPDLDNDQDGILDKADKCPMMAESFNGYKDQDGCPDFSKDEQKLMEGDQDNDNVPNDRDECITLPEDWDGFEDDDGCPDLDNDKDGILDEEDDCPNAAEVFNGIMDKDGCPDEDPDQQSSDPKTTTMDQSLKPTESAPVQQTEGDLDQPAMPDATDVPATALPPSNIFSGKYIYFDSSKASFTSESIVVLDQVAEALEQYPALRVEVSGYADSSGPEELNRKIAEKRALRVKDALLERGASIDQLTVKSYGEDNPIASNDTEDGKRKNRRVEFHISN